MRLWAAIPVLMLMLTLILALAPGWALAGDPPETAARSCHTLVKDDGRQRDVCITAGHFNADVCAAIQSYANAWKLPAGFFARLVWQESRFDPSAVSPAGAQGIAQFMPGTGRIRGLRDAFDPAEALARSAEYLSFLEARFGNLGLAAAAYNAGEGAMARATASGGFIPYETRDYVSIITGHPVEHWLDGTAGAVDYALSAEKPFAQACMEMAAARPMPQALPESAPWAPWGVLLWQDSSPGGAEAVFRRVQRQHSALIGTEEMLLLKVRNPSFGKRLRYSAMIGRPSQADAAALCARLSAAGANCIVQKNR